MLFLIDTNVMMAASAHDNPYSRSMAGAEPPDPELRKVIFNWLSEFEQSENGILLDTENLIRDEYDRNMRYNTDFQGPEYGQLVIQNKLDRSLYDFVTIEANEANGERIALLSAELTAIVTDREDRKWVAASIVAFDDLGETCPIVYGAESDWYQIEDDLLPHKVTFRRLLPDHWYASHNKAPR